MNSNALATTRLDRIRATMADERLDALYISAPVDDVYGRHSQNRFYASGFSGSAGVALITRERAIMAVDSRYTEQAGRECVPRGFQVWQSNGKQTKWLPDLLRFADLYGAKIGLSAADLTLRAFEAMNKSVADMSWGTRPTVGPASGIIEKLRIRKDADELAAIQKAIDIGDEAFDRVEATLEAGMTESAIARAIEEQIRQLGGSGVSFDTIVAGGAWGALPHASPRDEPVRAGEPIVIDMGAVFGGYCSDLTRTTSIGRFENPELRAIYEIVHNAQRNAIEKVEPGMSGAVVHRLAQDVIIAAGYGERFGHGLGHGVGLEVHEDPYLGLTVDDTLEDGMVFTIEPGIYLSGLGGVRIEDIVVLENGKARVLSHARKSTPSGV